MIGVGARLRFDRRPYAMALIGGGLGVLYLTAFAALELVPLLAPVVAFALLAAIAALAAVLALRFDAEALAALAAFGGLLAPVLVEAATSVALLFGYVAVVNATVLAIAWRRSWRALNLVGFLFTFLFALWWGFEFYRPEYFASVEPFLVLFFAAYVAVPVANGVIAPATDRRLDAMLVFGVPIVAFALQATLVRGTEHGLAWSAAAVALVYAILWFALRRRREPALAPLAAAHGALALIFATLVVPLAVDPHWTSAIWAVEAAGVYWNACRQDSRFGRAFGLVLQLATGAVFVLGGVNAYAEPAFADRQFMGIAAIALSGLATARFGDQRGESLPEGERALLPWVFAWACGWWLAGGALEVERHVAARLESHAMLAWVVGSVAVALALARPLRWPRLEFAALALLPSLAVAIAYDLWRRHTGMLAFGWALYPMAWALHFVVLHRAEARLSGSAPAPRSPLAQWLSATHIVGALLLLGQLAWEAGEWTARVTPMSTAWAACAHLLPLAAYLFAIAFAARRQGWPVRTFGEAYVRVVGTLVAVALGVGFAVLATLHPGDASPLPYVPVLNPLEITLVVALGAIFAWARWLSDEASTRGWIAAGAFVILNGAVIRAVHHWLDVPWRFAALAASKPLQAALTLTWSAAALALMLIAHRRGTRSLWLAGAGLLAASVVKLFVVDLAALSGLTRVVAFLGVGVLLLIWTLIPIYNIVMVSLESKGDVFTNTIFPEEPTLDSFWIVVTQGYWYLEYFWEQFGNSLYIGVATVFFTLAIGSLASFAIGRMRIRYGWLLSNAALLTYVIPASFLAIPFYRIMQIYGLTNNLWSVIAAEVTFATPYAIFIFQQYGTSIPLELDEAARIDGASPFQVYWKIYLPLMAPALVAVGTYALLLAWNEYLYQFLLLSSKQSMSVPVALAQFFNSDEAPWNYMMATAIVYAIPPVAIYYAFRRRMSAGLTMGGVKG